MKPKTLLFLFPLLVGALTLSAQSAPKIGIVDVQMVFQEFERFQEAREELVEVQKRAEASLAPRAEELQELREQIRSLEARINSPTITEESKLELQQEGGALLREFSQKSNQFEQLQRETQATVQQSRMNMENMALQEIGGAAAVVAEEKGLALVLRSQEQIVLFYDDSLDISDDVLEQLKADDDSEE